MNDFEKLRQGVNTTWAALAQAAFDLTNHVNGGELGKTHEEVEQNLGRAAEEYTAAKHAFTEAMRPRATRRPRR